MRIGVADPAEKDLPIGAVEGEPDQPPVEIRVVLAALDGEGGDRPELQRPAVAEAPLARVVEIFPAPRPGFEGQTVARRPDLSGDLAGPRQPHGRVGPDGLGGPDEVDEPRVDAKPPGQVLPAGRDDRLGGRGVRFPGDRPSGRDPVRDPERPVRVDPDLPELEGQPDPFGHALAVVGPRPEDRQNVFLEREPEIAGLGAAVADDLDGQLAIPDIGRDAEEDLPLCGRSRARQGERQSGQDDEPASRLHRPGHHFSAMIWARLAANSSSVTSPSFLKLSSLRSLSSKSGFGLASGAEDSASISTTPLRLVRL